MACYRDSFTLLLQQNKWKPLHFVHTVYVLGMILRINSDYFHKAGGFYNAEGAFPVRYELNI
jgi:hypothetical protein